MPRGKPNKRIQSLLEKLDNLGWLDKMDLSQISAVSNEDQYDGSEQGFEKTAVTKNIFICYVGVCVRRYFFRIILDHHEVHQIL